MARSFAETLHYMAWRRIRAAYYAFGLHRLPFGEGFGRLVSEWEIKQGFGDSPKAAAVWDTEYQSGSWDYLASFHELSRYSTLIGYMSLFDGRGECLDVGCGDGVLFKRFRPLGYKRYVGIDISEVAISRLRSFNDDRTLFMCADADSYEPSEKFDVIVFNESLYYLCDPIGALLRYSAALKPEGFLLVSTYTASRRSLAVLRDAKSALSVVDETKTMQGELTWLCTVLRPKSRQQASRVTGGS